MDTVRIPLPPGEDARQLFGNLDENLGRIEEAFGVSVILRDGALVVSGEQTDKAESAFRDLIWILANGDTLDPQKVGYVISLSMEGQSYRESNVNRDIVAFTQRGKPIKAKTLGQTAYVEAIKSKEIVFGIGPAGTGKTYLAVAMAVAAFKNKDVEKIILARPAVEAGERLGFLPGDLQEKVDPYLRPLYDALYDILGREAALRLKEKETIEVVPLAYMRGRTLDNAFIILDEAQNTTREQMKMFLTRMGFGSKVVVTGDVTQIDLDGKQSGLVHAEKVLAKVREIAFCYLTDSDVVRHTLVRKIIGAYDSYERKADEKGRKSADKDARKAKGGKEKDKRHKP
ncbi:MAG: PhoH family protein [Clostridiales Family XIII bacterium]|jgi:phosphate starvation-inducible PhoH-like protein|nr:PhoH family protein [Clostridiales Family XIII bacterium]